MSPDCVNITTVQVTICLAVLGVTTGFPQLGNYNGPQSAAPAGSDYGAAAAPACRTEYKQECSTTTERECTTVNEQQVGWWVVVCQ